MHLTTAQLQALKTDVLANTATIPAGQPWTNSYAGVQVKDVPNTTDGNDTVAGWYNQPASPNFTVWKTNVPLNEIGDAMSATEVAGLTTANLSRLQVLAVYGPNGINPSKVDRRAAFDEIFSGAGGATTRANLLVLWKRVAIRIEKVLSTGTGSDANPATMQAGAEGPITREDVKGALAS